MKHFKYLNLKKLHNPKYKKNNDITEYPGRRKFVKAMGLGALAWNPMVSSIRSLQQNAIQISVKNNELKVWINKSLCWKISPHIFEPNYKLKYRKINQKHLINATGLRFKNSTFEFSISALIDEGNQWNCIFKIPEINFAAEGSFTDWLCGNETFNGKANLKHTIACFNSNNDISALGAFKVKLSPSWKLHFKSQKGVFLSMENKTYVTDQFSIEPAISQKHLFLSSISKNSTLVELENFKDWGTFVKNIPLDSGVLTAALNETPDVQLIFGTEGSMCFSSSNDLNYTPANTLDSNIQFRNFFFFAEYLNDNQSNSYISGSLSQKGSWMNTLLGSFKLATDDKLPDFEAFGNQELINEVYFEPRLSAFKPRILNAVSLSTAVQDPPKVRITTAPGRTTLKKPTTTTTDQDPKKRKTNTQTSTNKIQINVPVKQDPPSRKVEKNSSKLKLDLAQPKFRPKRAINIRVLRPEDMVLLEFTFHNFNYTNKGQSPYLELDNTKKPGIVVINFQSQHTLEEAYFEETKIKDTDELKPSDSGVKLPARHIRARKSRLVYELPAGHEGFPVIMEELLDWSKYTLRVHPRAWIKIPSIKPIRKPSRIVNDKKSRETINPNIKYIDSPTTEYGLKLAQNTRIKANSLQVYQEQQISKVLNAQTSITVKPSFQLHKIKSVSWLMGPIPDLNTSIEAPALLYISPNQTNDFYHKTALSLRNVQEPTNNKTILDTRLRALDSLSTRSGEISELWHTRLGVKLKNGKTSGSALQHLKTIRALWADDASLKYDNPPNRNKPFMASLDANNRHKLVHTTSNYGIGFEPFPVPVNNLMLTTLGAYLDWHAFFDVPSKQDDFLNIIEWEHKATLGRDHFVKIVEEGYLFPFGHRAAVVKITERKFDPATKAAANRQRMFVVVLEKEILYSRNDPDGSFIEFPFQQIHIKTNATPNIDDPQKSTLDNGIGKTFYNFYINVGTKGFPFDIVATDKEGQEHAFRLPLAFVENKVARDKNFIKKVIKEYQGKSNNNYNAIYNEADFYGREVAYAQYLVDNDTAFETEMVKFDAQLYPVKGDGQIQFHPKMKEAKIYVKQINELTGIREPATIGLEDDNNKAGVFARVISNNVVDFTGGSDKAGGFLMPNMAISGISKLQGPVNGNLENIKNLNFIPDDFFEAFEDLPVAKIFGVIDIISLLLGTSANPLNLSGSFDDMINAVQSIRKEIDEIKNQILYLENLAEETQQEVENEINNLKQQIANKVNELLAALNDSVPRIPNLKSYVTEEAFYAEYRWQPELGGKEMSVIPGLISVNVDDPKTALSITTRFEKPFNADKQASLIGNARFEKFEVDIEPLLAVKFNYLEFKSGSSQKTDVKVDIDKNDPIKFKGVLNFVNNLQSIIPSGGFSDDGPYIDLKPTGVTAGFTISIPNVEVGICMISNISLGANITLPFTGAPLTMGFNFCKRENPFLLTVSCFGGGGYFMMVTTLKGLQSIEAAFEFGAAMSLNVGVASGGVSAMGGFYYKMELIGGEEQTTLAGYLRLNGHLSILGLISVSLEFYLAFVAVIYQGKVQKLEGQATLKVKVEVLFFSKTVSVSVRRELKGADADPKFIEMIDQDDWQEYCLAFAS